jgi:hypothetical protein
MVVRKQAATLKPVGNTHSLEKPWRACKVYELESSNFRFDVHCQREIRITSLHLSKIGGSAYTTGTVEGKLE